MKKKRQPKKDQRTPTCLYCMETMIVTYNEIGEVVRAFCPNCGDKLEKRNKRRGS